MYSKIKMIGRIQYNLTNQDGETIASGDVPNLVVTTGTELIANLLGGNSATLMSHMAVGTGSAAPTTSQTALVAEIGRVAIATTVVSNSTVQYTAVFPPGVGTGTIAEAGLFNAPTSGVMLSRSNSISVIKGAGDTLNVVWTISFAGV